MLMFNLRTRSKHGSFKANNLTLLFLDCAHSSPLQGGAFSAPAGKLQLFLYLPVSFLTTYFRHGKNLSILEILMLQGSIPPWQLLCIFTH